MAKQESLIKVRGKVGDLSFTKHRTRGHEVRMKGGVDKQRIMTDPNFQRTRENMQEFGSAAHKAKQLRQQLNNLSRGIADKKMGNRLTSIVHRIQKANQTASRGERRFLDEHAGLLKGFEFNVQSSLKTLFTFELKPTYDRATGEVSLQIPSFRPLSDVLLLQGATHMRFMLAAAQLGAEDVLPRPVFVHSEDMPLIGDQPATTLDVALAPELTEVVYLVVGISMYQEGNDGQYALFNQLYNAATIVDVYLP